MRPNLSQCALALQARAHDEGLTLHNQHSNGKGYFMSIYDQHDKAFNNVSAYVIAHNTKHGIERIATIAFKRGATGNVKCFFHHIGFTMQAGNAGGGGYDKPSAAFYDAAVKNARKVQADKQASERDIKDALAIVEAAKAGNGSSHWHNALRDAGYSLLQTV